MHGHTFIHCCLPPTYPQMDPFMLNHATPLVTCTDTFCHTYNLSHTAVIYCTHVQLTNAYISETSSTQVAITILLCTPNDVILSMSMDASAQVCPNHVQWYQWKNRTFWLRRWPSWPESMAMFLLLYNISIYVCTYMAYKSLASSSWSLSSYILMSVDTTPTAS